MQPITRRSFLASGVAGLGLAATAPHFLSLSSRAFAASQPPQADRVLVVLQLSGGNDGLSMLVPFADPAYHRARRTAAVDANALLKLNDTLALHPQLEQLRALYDNSRLALVQGVSYPNPNRSHFKSMDIWHTADLRGRARDTGWLGRAVDACCPDVTDPELMINVGRTIPYALLGKLHKPISFENAEQYRWTGNPTDRAEFERLNGPATAAGQIRWLHRVAVDARRSSKEIRAAAAGYQPKADYPRSRLAGDLRTVAALIAGEHVTRVYYVGFGGFDTHTNQRARYDSLMRELDPAVGAFWTDLRAQGNSKRVLMLSFSEFGRRVEENASGGTDHGVAGPMLLLGDSVRGGLHGRTPSLTDLDGNGDLRMQADFRSVYGEVLDDWMGVPSDTLLGSRFQKLGLLSS